jgi:hypothetical protein
MNTLLERIEKGEAFEKHHLGAQPIFHCLKSLNDLVRLSQALGWSFRSLNMRLLNIFR